LERDDRQTALRIGNPLLEGNTSQKLFYNDHSLATLNVDVDQVLSIYKQFLNMGIQTDLNSQDALSTQLKGKLLHATIFADEYGL
jgi:metal-dependent HD superfamily phosphatase/phosphodiesterase